MALLLIESFEFGRIIIDGKIYKDIVIHQGRISEWKWHEHHAFTIEDIKPVLDDIDVLVLGTGTSGFVHIKQDVVDFLESNNIKYFAAKSDKACERYNEFVKAGKKASAIIHSTC